MDAKGDKMQHIKKLHIMVFIIAVISIVNAKERVHNTIATVLHESFELPLDTSWQIFADTAVDSATFVGTYHAYGEGVDGSAALKIEVLQPQAQSWHVQLIVADWKCEKDKLYRFSMRAKGKNPVYFSVTEKPNFDYREGCTFNIYENFDRYSYLFSSDISGDGILRLSISVGESTGTYLFDEIMIEEVLHLEPEGEWYNNADQRIEEIRKGDFTLNLSSDVESFHENSLSVELVQHDFKFGSAVNFDTTVSDTTVYKEKILDNFNTIVTENALKWVDYEPVQGATKEESFLNYTNFADTNNLFLRGHVLAWGLQKNGFQDHWSIQQTPEFFASKLKERIIRDVSRYKGLIDEYDVWNEPIHEKYIFNWCYDPSNYYWLMDSAFHWAHAIDPDAGLYINEYNVVCGGRTETLYDFVDAMKKRNVPVTGIGVQCHFEEKRIFPEVIRRRLDILEPLGLDIQITEFDMGTHEEGLDLTENEMAIEYCKFIRTAFSHPAVDGLILWGFTDDIIWVGPTDSSIGAGLYDVDGNPKIVKDSIDNLWKKQWHTALQTQANENGAVSFRGFYGTYRISYEDPQDRATYECYVTVTKESTTASAKLKKVGSTNLLKKTTPDASAKILVSMKGKSLSIQNAAKGKVSLYNTLGQEVLKKEVGTKRSHHLPLHSLSKGIYFLTIETALETFQKRIIL